MSVVLVSGSDPRSASYAYFSAADAGVKTIPVTLYTAGVQAVTISDILWRTWRQQTKRPSNSTVAFLFLATTKEWVTVCLMRR